MTFAEQVTYREQYTVQHAAVTTVQTRANEKSNATMSYDALGRTTGWNQTGAGSPHASKSWKYDANGNIRATTSSFARLNENGHETSRQDETFWYRFDALNRVVTDKGRLEGGQIVRGTTGTDYLYDAAGQRVSAKTSTLEYYATDDYSYGSYTTVRQETYAYDTAGRLVGVAVAAGSEGAMGAAVQLATYAYDAMGRQTQQTDYSNGQVAYNSFKTYNAKGQLYSDNAITRGSDGKLRRAETICSYDTGSHLINSGGDAENCALGAVTLSVMHNYETSGTWLAQVLYNATGNLAWQHKYSTSTHTTYLWADGAQQATVSYRA